MQRHLGTALSVIGLLAVGTAAAAVNVHMLHRTGGEKAAFQIRAAGDVLPVATSDANPSTVTLGPGNYLSLINLRTRGRVAMTGGQDQLQVWAVEVLAKPREQMQQDGSGWLVPREEWSEQVRHLGGGVRIDPLWEGGRSAVRLCYGGGFFHWYIVVGPPGSAPDPNLVKERPFDAWYRWGDGVYGWFPEN